VEHEPQDGTDAPPRPVAPGGWRRALIGFAIGVGAGVLVALLLPRDDGPRRASPRAEDLGAPGPSTGGGPAPQGPGSSRPVSEGPGSRGPVPEGPGTQGPGSQASASDPAGAGLTGPTPPGEQD
jgi:hypothetical protein